MSSKTDNGRSGAAISTSLSKALFGLRVSLAQAEEEHGRHPDATYYDDVCPIAYHYTRGRRDGIKRAIEIVSNAELSGKGNRP